MADEYSVLIKCGNCDFESSINIQKGTSVIDALILHKCEDCDLIGTCDKIGR